MHQLQNYVEKAINSARITFGLLITTINFVIFPEKAYAYAAFALGGAVLVDIFSKYVFIVRHNGGWLKAFRRGKLLSKTLWVGTKVKLQAYLAISVMVGLSYRLNALEGAFTSVSLFMATVVYTVLFLREFQSILENFRDAGAKNLEWLLFWTKSREKEIFLKHSIEDSITEEKIDDLKDLDKSNCNSTDGIEHEDDYESLI